MPHIYTQTHTLYPQYIHAHTHIRVPYVCAHVYYAYVRTLRICVHIRALHMHSHAYISQFLGIGCRRDNMSCLGCKRRSMSCRCVMPQCCNMSCRCVMPQCFQVYTLHTNAASTRPNTYIRTLYTHTHTHIRTQCVYSHAHSTLFLPITLCSYKYPSIAAIYSSIYAPYKCPAYTCTHIVYTCTHIHALHVCI